MNSDKQATAIGGFILGGLVLIVVAIFLFTKINIGKESEDWVLFFEDSVSGLDVGASVVFRGVRIGKVTEIEIVNDFEKAQVYTPVFIEVYLDSFRNLGDRAVTTDEYVYTMVNNGLRAQLQTQSLITGKLIIAFDFFPDIPAKYAGILNQEKELPTAPSTVSQIAKKLEELPLEDIATSMLKLVEDLDRIVNSEKVADILARLDGALGEYQLLAGDVREQLPGITTELAASLREYRTLGATLNQQAGPLVASVQTAVTGLETTLATATDTLKSLEATLGDESELEHQLSGTLLELSRAARSLRLLADYLERHPEALIYGKGGKAETIKD